MPADLNKNFSKQIFSLPKLRSTFNGLDDFSPLDRTLILIFIGYLFVSPILSSITYELYVEEQHEFETLPFLMVIFFIPVAIHTSFIINNLKVGNSFSIALLTLRVPIEIIINHFIYGWDFLYSISMIYIIELFSFMTGFTAGTLFRKAKISVIHRITSFFLAAFCMLVVFSRFILCFLVYFDSKLENFYEIGIAVLTLSFAAVPYIRIFIFGKDNEELQTGNSKLSEKFSAIIGIAALIHVIAVPLIVLTLIR